MKKILFVLIILFTCLNVIKASDYYTTTNVSCSINDAPWSKWIPLRSTLVIDRDRCQITIYSDIDYSSYSNEFNINYNSIQIIDYEYLNSTMESNSYGQTYRLELLNGNDKHGINCTVRLLVYTNGRQMFVISYKDVQYRYLFK